MINKKKNLIFVISLGLLGLMFTLGKSYAYFETSISGSNITLGVGKLAHSLNSDVKLQAGESRIIDLIVKSSDDVTSKYQVYYKSDNDLTNVSVGYSSDSINLPSGEIEARERKKISIILVNDSSNTVSIELGVKGGLAKNTVDDIILEKGEFRVETVIDKDIEQIKTSSELYAFYKGSFDATATANNILSGKTAWVNGQKLTGSMAYRGSTPEGGVGISTEYPQIAINLSTYPQVTTGTDGNSYFSMSPPEGYYSGPGSAYASLKTSDLASAIGLTADKLVDGKTVLGIEGETTDAIGTTWTSKASYASNCYPSSGTDNRVYTATEDGTYVAIYSAGGNGTMQTGYSFTTTGTTLQSYASGNTTGYVSLVIVKFIKMTSGNTITFAFPKQSNSRGTGLVYKIG